MDSKLKIFVSDCIDYTDKERGIKAHEDEVNKFITGVMIEKVMPTLYEHAECGTHFHLNTTILYKEPLK